jgi:hypothetical protein
VFVTAALEKAAQEFQKREGKVHLMTEGISRRAMLKTVGTGTAGLLLRREFAYAGLGEEPVRRRLPVGQVGLELRVTAMNANTLRLSVAAIDENLEKTYGDGSVVALTWPAPLLKVGDSQTPQAVSWGKNKITVRVKPLRVTVEKEGKGVAQELVFDVARTGLPFDMATGRSMGWAGLHPLSTGSCVRHNSAE